MNEDLDYLNSDLNLESRVDNLLDRLELDEKISLLRGKNLWTTESIERLDLPRFGITDGPLGVAFHSSQWGRGTRFPAPISLAASWNEDLAYEMGRAMAVETKLSGRHQILAPGVNIIRSPLCGRNFEYLSEDPVLSSDIGVEIVKGIQSQNVASCVKHYIANNSETERKNISVEVGERALFEIYVKNFKRIIEKSDPWSVMSCYNKINGVYGSENKYLLRDVLRDQLGFKGHVVSDWGAAKPTSGPSECIKAGLNLEMPGNFLASRAYKSRKIKKVLEQGKISEEDINRVVRPLLRTFFCVGLLNEEETDSKDFIDNLEHQKIARRIAEEGTVLLKNEDDFLPLDLDEISKISIKGPNSDKKFGKPLSGGSSAVVPPFEVTPEEGIKEYVSDDVEVVSEPEKADVVFLCVGLDHGGVFPLNSLLDREGDTEGRDRTSYQLPEDQNDLISNTVAKNPNTVVILIAGSPVDVSGWFDDIPALLNLWYPGMKGGEAIARIIFGEISPSGKLPVTYPKNLEDHPAHKSERRFPGDLEELEIHYEEGIYVGYRYFDEEEVEPFFPFGYGLSYTDFDISDIEIDKDEIEGEENFTVTVKVENIGDRTGSEVVQLYIEDEECSVERPPKELQAFDKVKLQPGEEKKVSFQLDRSAFEFYSVEKQRFMTEPGLFTVKVGRSSRDLPLSDEIIYKSSD